MSTSLQPEILRRTRICNAGRLVYQAQIDQEKLECLYCMMCACCKKQEAAQRSFFDVYTNGILTNTPIAFLMCCLSDYARFMFFDDNRIGNNGKAGCCTPFPCFCPHCCDCCGEVYYFYRMCVCGCNWTGLGIGHCQTYCCGCCCGCCILDQFCGLAPGEAQRIQLVIANTRLGNFGLIPYPPLHTEPIGAMPMVAWVDQTVGQVTHQSEQQPAQKL